MSRDGVLLAVLGVFVVVLLLAAFAGVFGLRTSTSLSVSSEVPNVAPPEDGSAGVVMFADVRPGQRILGIRLERDKFSAHVHVVMPLHCVQITDQGIEVVREDGDCAGLPAHGEVIGDGTTQAGGNLVIVRVDISEECYEALEFGTPWPSPLPACAAQ